MRLNKPMGSIIVGCVLALLMQLSNTLKAQTFTIGGPISSCSGHFYDAGGPAGNYSNSSNLTSTICPPASGSYSSLLFNSASVESGWDAIYVYNGPTTGSPLFNSGQGGTIGGFPAGGYGGTSATGLVFTSTDVSGCLTVKFLSDASVNMAGWDATISCFTPCAGMPAAGTTQSSGDNLCPATGFTLSLLGASTDQGITYQWQSSADGVNFSDVAGATSSTLTTTQAGDTYYHCVLTCTGSGLSDTSVDWLQHTATVSAAISGTAVLCGSGAAPITVTFTGPGIHNFVYLTNGANPQAVSTASNPYVFNVSPSGNTVYTLQSVDNGTCSGSVGGSANISFNASLSAVIASSTAVVCSGSNFQAQLSGSNGSNIDWQSTATPLVPASWVSLGLPNSTSMSTVVNTNTYFRAVVTSPGCPTVVSNTVGASLTGTPAVVLQQVTSHSMVASWTPNQSMGGTYSVTVSGTGNGTGTFNNVQSPYTIGNLSPNSLYTVSVSQLAAFGACAPVSGSANATTTCAEPTLSLSAIDNTHEVASWVASSAGDSLFYHKSISPAWTRVHASSPDTLHLVAGTTYDLYVKTQCGDNSYAASAVSSFTTGGTTCNNVPTITAITPNCSNQALVQWNAIPGISTYRINLMRVSPTVWSLQYDVNGTSYNMATLPGGTYQVCLRSVCGSSSISPASATVTYTAPDAAPAPDNIVVSNIGCHGFDANWSAVSNAEYYTVKITQQNSGVSYSYDVPGTSFHIGNLGNGSAWNVSVSSVESCGQNYIHRSQYNASVPAQLLSCREEEASVVFGDLDVYPNPGNGTFNVSFNNAAAQAISYKVINVLGQTVFQRENQEAAGAVNQILHLEQLPAGSYYLLVSDQQTMLSKQLILIK